MATIENTMHRTVQPSDAAELNDLLEELPAGAVVELAPGLYVVNLFVAKSVHLRGAGPGVVLDGKHRAPVVQVARRDVDLVVENVTLRRGSGGGAGDGGNLSVHKARTVVLRDVELLDGEADANGGGGLRLGSGEVTLERCRFAGNHGARASAILVEGGQLLVRDSVLSPGSGSSGGAIAIAAGVLSIAHTTIAHNDKAAIAILGAPGPGPTVTIVDSKLAGVPLVIAPGVEPKLSVERTESDPPIAR